VDLYRRIHAGIKGTPMPAFNTALKEEEIWDLVNYVMSVPYAKGGAPSSEAKGPDVAKTDRQIRDELKIAN
jgi:mono/diheme cytochrome c family protein